METAPRQENIKVKYVKWYKSAFKVQVKAEKQYEYALDPQTNRVFKDQNGEYVLKKDENGQLVPKLDKLSQKQMEKPVNSKVYENKIATSDQWLLHRHPVEFKDKNTDKEAMKKNEPKWVQIDNLPTVDFIQQMSDKTKSEKALKKKAMEMYEKK